MKWYEAILQATRLKKLSVSADENLRREAWARFDSQEPGAVHREPDCHGHNGCRYPEPHHHGFACDRSCSECWKTCHPECPANETIKKEK